MMALDQAREYLEQLGLTEAAAVLDNRLDLAPSRSSPTQRCCRICWALKPPLGGNGT